VTELPTADASDVHKWMPAKTFDDIAMVCCNQLHMDLLTDPESFSVTRRLGRIGAVTVTEIAVGPELSIDAGEACGAYRVIVACSGRIEGAYQGLSFAGGPGAVSVFPPRGKCVARWTAGSRFISFKFDRCTVDDALGDALGRQVLSQPDFAPVMPSNTATTRTWINMVALFRDQVFRPDSLLNQPLVGLPFVDSLVRGFLLAADHAHREALSRDVRPVTPRAIRSAIEIIEAEADQPLTASALAARTHVSVRCLQQGFRSHLDVSPMEYVRQVRLRRAHQALLDSDPSSVTVASIAYRWGFTNLGRFAAAHTARYRETPTQTLRRRTFQRLTAEERIHVKAVRR
jgi:AraC-like DNA-binding protein